MKTIFGSRRDHYLVAVSIFLITVALIAGLAGCLGYNPPPSQNLEIQDWYDLDAIRDNLSGNHILMNDLDSTTPGYEKLASPRANGGKGWEAIGWGYWASARTGIQVVGEIFKGTLDGQGYEIRDLYINSQEQQVGLFGFVAEGAIIKDITLINATVTDGEATGGPLGFNEDNVRCFDVASVVAVGGLVGYNGGTVSNCYVMGNVNGDSGVGGMVGDNEGTVSNCYATGSVSGSEGVGGLVGYNFGTVSNSCSTGSVSGNEYVGGLVGLNHGTVSNSYYNYDKALINGKNVITAGALFGEDFEEWLADDKFLDVNERLSQENGYYLINDVSDFKQLLVFGQNDTLKFRLTNDLDLGDESNFYIPYFAGEFDGNNHRISNLSLSFNFGFVYNVGLFGYLAPGGKVTQVGIENVNITAASYVGGLAGVNRGTVGNSYSTGSVTGHSNVGGLTGHNWEGTVSNSYSSSSVTGEDDVGGLVGRNLDSTVSNSYSTGSVTGHSNVGGLTGHNWEGTISNSYSTGNVTGDSWVGGLVGYNYEGTYEGIVSNCYSTGSVTGAWGTGGLAGGNIGVVSNSYSSGNVIGDKSTGGLVGFMNTGTVSNSYSTGSVTGNVDVGGLVGANWEGTLSNSYYNYGEVLINGENVITFGALFGENFEEWLANDKFLDVNERLSQENGYYVVNNVSDFKQLWAFGQDATLKFRLTNDLDLVDEPNFYIPYLAGEFDGNGHKILNLSCDFGSVSQVGLFGYLASDGKVTEVGVENVNITGVSCVGGLVGLNVGTVSSSHSSGSVTGEDIVGGLVGWNKGTVGESYSIGSMTGNWRVGGLVGLNDGGTVSNSYSTGNVNGSDEVGGLVGDNGNDSTVESSYSTSSVTGEDGVGGLVGENYDTVSKSYSTGSVTGNSYVGGLVGRSFGGTVSDSFWDTETSGQATSDGGMGKTTAQMKDIATFSGAGWKIIAVALNQTNPSYIWNIVDVQTYPFLSWQS